MRTMVGLSAGTIQTMGAGVGCTPCMLAKVAAATVDAPNVLVETVDMVAETPSEGWRKLVCTTRAFIRDAACQATQAKKWLCFMRTHFWCMYPGTSAGGRG